MKDKTFFGWTILSGSITEDPAASFSTQKHLLKPVSNQQSKSNAELSKQK